MCYYAAESVTEEIMELYSVIRSIKAEESYQNLSDNLNTVFQRLDYLIAQDICDKRAEEFIYNLGFDSAFDAISSFRSLYTAEIEVEHAKAIIKSGDPWKTLKNFAYIPNYLQLAKTEYQGSQLKPGDHVLFLGSGPRPISLIILCRLYGLRGIGIEQEPERAELSRKVLQKLELSDQIKIIAGNHFTLPLKEKSELLMVAAAAEPKKEISDHLVTVLPAGTKVSYRIYEKGLRRLLETSSFPELPEQFKEYLRIRPEPPVNNTVVFLATNGIK
jgi:hypothetical protein